MFTLREKNLDGLCNCKSEISNVCNAVEGHCLQAIKIVRHHANGSFDWLISGDQSVDPSREAISILSDKHKRFTFGHPVKLNCKVLLNVLIVVYVKRHLASILVLRVRLVYPLAFLSINVGNPVKPGPHKF